jgi:signal transduction histidine kinase/ABC-type uncharacterized transport system substrate-binding protein
LSETAAGSLEELPFLSINPRRAVLWVVLVLLCSAALAAATDASDRKVVVLLYAAAPLRPVPIAVDEAIRTTLAAGVSEPIQFHTEFLDLSWLSGEQQEQRAARFLRDKYADLKIDLVIAISTPALQFLLEHRAQVFPGLPVVFCGVDANAVESLELAPDVRGVRMHPEWGATLSAALALHPDTSRVAVVSGTSQIDRAWRAAAARDLAKHDRRVEVGFLGDQPMERLLNEVADLPKGTIVLYVSLLRDATGRPFDGVEALSAVARAANAPVYGWSETYLGHGIVGGRLIDFEVQGVRAGELGLRILRGEKPESLPILDEGAKGYMFDGRELRRWGISETRLPPGSIVRYEEASLWARYRWRVIGGGMLVLAGSLLLTGFVLQRTGRRRADLALAERLRFETLLSEQSLAFSRLPATDIDGEIERGLRQIVDFLRVDRGSLAEFSADSRTAHITHSWAAEGVEPLPSALRLAQFPWVTARILRGEVVRFSRSEELPEADAAVDRQTYRDLGITSHVEVPLMVEGKIVGALALSTLGTTRLWRDDLVQRLRLLGEVFASILSRRRAEMEAQRLRQDLAHVGRVSTLGELTASLAHELNQPLTAILSNAQAAQRLLRADPTDLGEVRAILKDIVEDDQRAAAVIHRLRGLLKKSELELAILDLNELVSEVARLVSSDMAARGVVLRLELAAGLAAVRGDRVQLQQVVLNLILNGLDAIGASPTGDRTLVLRTDTDGPAAVRVAVRDSGTGIDEADLDHIFHAFYTTKSTGLGMGLAIARSIVDAHGGRLEAHNNADGGATFSFSLPLAPDQEP